jgi:hypothetical protein
MRSCISAAKSLGFVMIIVQDFSRSPVSRFFNSSHSPVAVRIGEPSRAVKCQGCLPAGRVLPFVMAGKRSQAARAFEGVVAGIEGCHPLGLALLRS